MERRYVCIKRWDTIRQGSIIDFIFFELPDGELMPIFFKKINGMIISLRGGANMDSLNGYFMPIKKYQRIEKLRRIEKIVQRCKTF